MRVDELSWGEDTDIFLCERAGLQKLQAMNGDGEDAGGDRPADTRRTRKAKTS